MSFNFGRISRFRFNMPQRVAAVMLALFLAQGFWVARQQTLSATDYKYARCGREIWENASPVSGYQSSCGNLHDGILAYRVAGLPLSLNVLYERLIDRTRKPEDRVMQTDAAASTWEMRHQLTHVLLLLRLPFLLAGAALGAALWWVTRRLFGNWAGYLALGLYCFTPGALRASLQPNAEILAALGFFGGLYCCIGVAHAMQGPKKRWRPRIVLLTICFAVTAASHIVALPLLALFGLLAMLWIAEGRRSEVLPVVLIAFAGALALLFAAYGFSLSGILSVLQSGVALMRISLQPIVQLTSSITNVGIVLAGGVAVMFYASFKRTRFFGNTVPLLCFVGLIFLVTTGVHAEVWLWALPFLLVFIAGVFADVFEGPQGKLALAAAAVTVALQAIFCVLSLPGMV